MPTPTDPTTVPFWQQPAFWITVMLMIPIYFIVGVVLWPGWSETQQYSESTRVMVITSALVATIAAILGFWLAGSHNSKPNPDADKTANKPTTPGEKK